MFLRSLFFILQSATFTRLFALIPDRPLFTFSYLELAQRKKKAREEL